MWVFWRTDIFLVPITGLARNPNPLNSSWLSPLNLQVKNCLGYNRNLEDEQGVYVVKVIILSDFYHSLVRVLAFLLPNYLQSGTTLGLKLWAHKMQSLFFYYNLLIIISISIQITVNFLLPHPIFLLAQVVKGKRNTLKFLSECIHRNIYIFPHRNIYTYVCVYLSLYMYVSISLWQIEQMCKPFFTYLLEQH